MIYRIKSQLNIVKRISSLQLRFSSSDAPIVEVQQNNGIKIITLNNENKRNALSYEMLKGIEKALTTHNTDTRVVLIRSKGNVFSSGHFLKELTEGAGYAMHSKVLEKCTSVMKLVQDIEVPVISEVRGLASAAGCQLVASCDIVIASENAKFTTPGVNIGLFCHTPGVAVSRAISRKTAMLMLFTGQPINATEALTQGLISKVVKDENLEAETNCIAEKIASNSRPVNALGKSTFYKQSSMPRNEAYRFAESKMLENLNYADAKEGISAFLEKRKPKWTNSE